VIVVSGSCLGVIRSKYPDYASKPGVEIVHATEAIAELIEDGSLKLNQPVHQKVTYHDPCYLGRQSEPTPEWKGEEKIALGVMTYTEPPRPVNFGTNGVFEAPREILGAVPGLDFIEMQRVREYAYCCGGGGGAPEAYPELARTAAEHRLEEARSTGAETLVTACASCMGQLAGAQNGQDEAVARMRVVDVIDLAFEAAGLKE